MYISEPNVFGVPISRIKEDILGIKIAMFPNYASDIDLVNTIVPRKEIVIGVSFPTQRELKWIRDKANMEEYAKAKGVILKSENADTNVALQALQVDKLISQGINILVIGPIDSEASSSMVQSAKKSGLNVIAYDRIILNSDVDLFISVDHKRIGQIQGKFLIDHVPKGNYVIMSGDPRDYNSILMKEGAMEYLTPLIAMRDIKIVEDKPLINWNPNIAYDVVKNALTANKNKINAILAPNDASAGAAIKALEEKGFAGKVIVTGMDGDLDAIRRIAKGTQSMTVLKNTKQLDMVVIDSAIKMVNNIALNTNAVVFNEKKYVPTLYTLPVLITKDNIEETIIKSGYWTKDEVYGNLTN